MQWPAWVVDTYQRFFATEPHPASRIEVTLARIGARYLNVHKAPGESAQVADFLVLPTAWDPTPKPDPDAPVVSIFSR